MKLIITVVAVLSFMSSLVGCQSIKRGQAVAAKMSEYSTTHKYKVSAVKLEKAIGAHLRLFGSMGQQGQVVSVPPPMTRGYYKFQDKLGRVSGTLLDGQPYNKVLSSYKKTVLVSRDKIYTIQDKGSYRTLEVRKFSGAIPVRRKSAHKVDVSILGVGVNYKDFKNIDELIESAEVEGMEQWQIFSRVEPKLAKQVRLGIQAEVDSAAAAEN